MTLTPAERDPTLLPKPPTRSPSSSYGLPSQESVEGASPFPSLAVTKGFFRSKGWFAHAMHAPFFLTLHPSPAPTLHPPPHRAQHTLHLPQHNPSFQASSRHLWTLGSTSLIPRPLLQRLKFAPQMCFHLLFSFTQEYCLFPVLEIDPSL